MGFCGVPILIGYGVGVKYTFVVKDGGGVSYNALNKDGTSEEAKKKGDTVGSVMTSCLFSMASPLASVYLNSNSISELFFQHFCVCEIARLCEGSLSTTNAQEFDVCAVYERT